jgi:adenylosuccinate synthase
MTHRVIGLGFGDEGKGLTTSFLCSKEPAAVVVRFNGGHQAGHTVVHNSHRHVFSGFGSGTLQGNETYWSHFCTFYPPSFVRERSMLEAFSPKITVHPDCPVTTYFDVDHNRVAEKTRKHGSVGMGFGATIAREEAHYCLRVRDLEYPTVLRLKLESIVRYYGIQEDVTPEIDLFMAHCAKALKYITISGYGALNGRSCIFEGAQGVLLDQSAGFFPHVTRSNTTSQNSFLIRKEPGTIWYVTRSYLTRHGNGPLPGECSLELAHNEQETNQLHEYQGQFRTAPLNIELLKYAISVDSAFSGKNGRDCTKALMITCVDQYMVDLDMIKKELKGLVKSFYISTGPRAADVFDVTKGS